MICDSALKLNSQISEVVKASFYQLLKITTIKPFLAHIDLEKLIHGFIFYRLDYCNSFYGDGLQMVQKSATRLLAGTRTYDHIAPVLRLLQWLPVPFTINLKILIFVFKSLHGIAPPYIADLIHVQESKRSLRSNGHNLIHTPRSKVKFRGDRTFAVAAPQFARVFTTVIITELIQAVKNIFFYIIF